MSNDVSEWKLEMDLELRKILSDAMSLMKVCADGISELEAVETDEDMKAYQEKFRSMFGVDYETIEVFA